MKTAIKSWRTTAAGILGFVAILAVHLEAALDADPLSLPDWGVVAGAAAAMVGLIMARDNTVSSEDVGITGTPR